MVRDTSRFDMGDIPALVQLAREVAATGRECVLTERGRAVAVLSPLPKRRRPLSANDSIREVIGAIAENGGEDVPLNNHMDGTDDTAPTGGRGPLGLRIPGLHYHPKAADANLEDMRKLSGIFNVEGPVPSRDLFDDEERGADARD